VIVNRNKLILSHPIKSMMREKVRGPLTSHGLSEAGYDIRIKQDVWLHPFRRFKLASAIEEFDMPTDLVGIVHDKSTWALKGLSVFNTVIEPGWRGWLTLELVYHGWRPLHVPAGSGIAQVLFHRTVAPASYDGKYQNQADKPVEAING